MASYSQPGSDTKFVTTGFPIKHLLRNRPLYKTSIGKSSLLVDKSLIQKSRSTKYYTRLSWDCSTIYYKHADIVHKGGYDTRVWWHNYWLVIKVVVHMSQWCGWHDSCILQQIKRRSEARWFYSGSGSVYDTSNQFQDRTGLTGTPLGVGLAIVLFIHEIAFVNIWPNQQARWVLWMYSQDSLDIRYNKCKHDAHEQISNAHSANKFALHDKWKEVRR